jgi:hypothetical protein
MNDLFSAILIIEGKNQIFFLLYLPKGNKQYYNLGPVSIFFHTALFVWRSPRPIRSSSNIGCIT